jgi:hypothetical protein
VIVFAQPLPSEPIHASGVAGRSSPTDAAVTVESDLDLAVQIATILSSVTSIIIAIGLLITIRQLNSSERARKLDAYTAQLVDYGNAHYLQAVELLKSADYGSLAEFRCVYADRNQLSEAWEARRMIKAMLSRYGYSIVHRISDIHELLPLISIDALTLWPKLRPVELDLVKEKGRQDLYRMGLDDVANIEALYSRYTSLLTSGRKPLSLQ